MRRIISVMLTLATVLSLFSFVCIPALAAAETFSARVGNVYDNVYVESYNEILTQIGSDSSGMRSWEGYAWRGDETFSRIDLLTRSASYDMVTLIAGDFVNENGDRLGDGTVDFTYLDAVTIYERMFTYGKDGYKIFDVITDENVRNLKSKSINCAWVAIRVPEDAKPGIYTATFSVISGEKTLAEFDYTLTVYDIVQPELASDVDLWMWPYNTLRYYSGLTTEELYNDGEYDTIEWDRVWNARLDTKYFPALKSELELYAKAGGDAIFAQIDEQNRTNGDPYPSLVKWTLKKDGTMAYDYTDFDNWVELNMECGIDGQIKCYDIGQLKNWVVYYDEAKGKVVARDFQFNDQKFMSKFYGDFLQDFMVHLEEKGWFDITYIALDEKDYNITKMVIDLVKNNPNKDGKTLKIATAVASYHCEELFDQIDDLSLAYGMMGVKMDNIMAERAEKGMITTIYTCGPQGSSMINTPGQSAESIHHTYKIGATGFLRWALQKYNADPYTSSQNYKDSLCSGDCYLIYPSKNISEMKAYSSPRYETLCEGIRDIEKAKFLEKNLKEQSSQVKADFMGAQRAADFREVCDYYSAMYISEEDIPTLSFESDNYVMNVGDTLELNFSEEGLSVIEGQAKQEFIDNTEFTSFSDGWTHEGQYFDLFFYSTNSYCSASISAANQKNLSYTIDFTGDALTILGTSGSGYGQASVVIDGVDMGKLDGYVKGGSPFSVLYEVDGLEYGKHTAVVTGAGKNAAAGGYRLQVDYAIVKTHAEVEYSIVNGDVATIDENGKVTAVYAGTTRVMVKCGDVFGYTTITVKPDAVALNDKKRAISSMSEMPNYPADVKADMKDAIALAEAAVTPEEIEAAYAALIAAENATVVEIELESKPIKLNFVEGEYFSAKGGFIKVTRVNGNEDYLNTLDYMASGYNTTYAGKYTVTLTTLGKEITYDITVNEKPDASKAFKDVKAGQWYEEAVNFAVGHGLFNGVSGTKFAPNDVMNRGMLVTVLYRMEGSPSIAGIKNPFKDVKEKDWYYAPVLWAAENGIVGGVGAGKFAPTDSLTREQLATILYRYSSVRRFDTEGRGDLTKFPDAAKVSSWATDAYSWANVEGLIGGNNIGGVAHLDPAGKATRAQVATILMRYQDSILKY